MMNRAATASLVVLAFVGFASLSLAQAVPAAEQCPSNLDTLILQLREEETWTRWQAAECLGALKDPRAVEPLVHALYAERYPRLSGLDANALKEINDPRATALLLEGLKSKRTREKAIWALGYLGAPEAVEPLINILRGTNNGERHSAATALGEIRDPRALKPLLSALRDKDVILRRYVALSLGPLGDPGAVGPLKKALTDEDDGVRWNSTVSLGQLKDADAVVALGEVLNDEDEDDQIRKAAADSLGEIRNPAGIDPLITAFKKSKDEVLWHAAGALAKFDEPEVSDLLSNSLRQGEYNIVAAAHEFFLRKRDPESIPTLVAALRASGYEGMAEDYIASGIPQLVEAGREWATRNEIHGVVLQ
jgi:HEAT repeat protein